jgi:hypothetical protein
MQLLSSLLCGLKAACATFPDSRKGRGGNIAITDFGLAAFSMFFMQSSSFLAFQRALEKGQGRSNGQTLFGIGRIPSDNYIRGALDEADPALLQPCFERMETLLAEPSMRHRSHCDQSASQRALTECRLRRQKQRRAHQNDNNGSLRRIR